MAVWVATILQRSQQPNNGSATLPQLKHDYTPALLWNDKAGKIHTRQEGREKGGDVHQPVSEYLHTCTEPLEKSCSVDMTVKWTGPKSKLYQGESASGFSAAPGIKNLAGRRNHRMGHRDSSATQRPKTRDESKSRWVMDVLLLLFAGAMKRREFRLRPATKRGHLFNFLAKKYAYAHARKLL